MRDKPSTPDENAASRAALQHGVITAAQLAVAGLDRRAVDRRVKAGRLHRVYRGVYSVGHRALSNEGQWMAAVLACGEGAVLSHRSAAQLFNLLPAALPPIHVTVPSERRPKHAGITVHRSRTLIPAAVTARNRIPATKPWRTVQDLRRTEPPEVVREAIRQADFHGFPLGHISIDRTRSELERMFPALRQAFEDDRDRGLDLLKLGFELLRLSYRQIEDEPARVAEVLRDRLSRSAA